MNTGLGLSFWRIVNEEGSNGWAQIYARIPFDEVELKTKGALFGVIFGIDKENWADKDAELMAWVENYFNELDRPGDLVDFAKRWKTKYSDLEGVWLWVTLENGDREIKIARWGDSGVILTRNNKDFDLSNGIVQGKVIKGNINDGDKLVILTGKLHTSIITELSKSDEDDIAKQNKNLLDSGEAAAGLVLNIGKMVEEEVKEGIEVSLDQIIFENKEESPIKVEVSEVVDLAQDAFVGPIGLKEKISNWFRKRRSVSRGDLVDRKDTTKRKKWAMLIGVLFLILLVISLITGTLKMRKQAELKRWQEFSEPIEKSLQEAGGLVSVNPTGAKKLVEDVRLQFSSGKGAFVNEKYKDDLSDLEKKIEDTWTLASGEKQSQIEEVLRIDLVRQGFKGDRLGLIKKSQFMALDTAMGVVLTADQETKDIKVVAGKGDGLGWLDVAGDGNNVMVLSKTGVRNAVTGVDLIKFDAAVAEPVSMGNFGSNLYVLDKGNKEIYKYAATGDSFGDRTRWLKQDESIDFEPVDMTIDADIWVVSGNGEVDRFRRGAKENFSVSGLPTEIKIKRIAVEQSGTKLALLDAVNGSIAICSKETGNCNETLKSDKFKGAADIEFNEQGNLLVLYSGIVGVVQ